MQRIFSLLIAVALVACAKTDDATPSSDAQTSDSTVASRWQPDTSGTTDTGNWIDLVAPESWTVTPIASDPWGASAPEDLELCGEEGAHSFLLSDQLVLEVMTPLCPYVTLEQTLLEGFEAGDTLQVWVGHSTIFDQVGVFSAVFQLDGQAEALWSKEVTAPTPIYGSYMETMVAPVSASAGDVVRFHLSLGQAPIQPIMSWYPPPQAHGDSTWWVVTLARAVDQGG
ncbi:MAG: hypothetical protein ACI9WU_001512 [Myxococcota bacterium]